MTGSHNNQSNVVYLAIGIVLVAVIAVAIRGTNITGNAASRTDGACSETDKTNDQYVKGIVSFEHRSGVDTYIDQCGEDNKHLKQYFCSAPNRINTLSSYCEKGCKDGVCLK